MRSKERSIAGLFNTKCINVFNAAPGILAILEGDFSQLPETPSHEDWQTLALMIDGYELSEKLSLGELGDYLTKQCLPQYIESGRLPDKSIELWIFLFGMQWREKWSERPLEGQEKKAVFEHRGFHRSGAYTLAPPHG